MEKHLPLFFGGIVGWVKYLVPIGMVVLIVYIVNKKKQDDIKSKLLKFAIFIMSISVIITVYHSIRGNLNLTGDFGMVISNAYDQGTNNVGGGALRCYYCYAAC